MLYELRAPTVEAYEIKEVGPVDMYNGQKIVIEDGRTVQLTAQLLSKCPVNPLPGGYYVVDEAGAATIAWKAVFEKKWKKVEPDKPEEPANGKVDSGKHRKNEGKGN